ncbi:endonuclease MutS2 [Pseudobacteroides cellulosolvens]|uniref:Endonuclease MutS2 n=1 Tax=Pseudobacteroides cellulosolvens ATCC 35603 = DSM 2933 TaxID=398512 RepID=A0A0L6JHX0_9FIRM|nr:endonuclease MutS2 [Pseudobacteroides cellulosolvens]KNY25300.1 MutS2 protein [Pseudobacteroides cellulosolvens ATCC 35603 = DSM 2933]
MNEKTLRVLEFDKIIDKLLSRAATSLGKDMVRELKPEADNMKIRDMLKETDDGVTYILRKGSPPLGAIHDIRASLKRAELGATLGPGELLKVADLLRACRNLKGYAGDNIVKDDGNCVSSLISALEVNKRIEDKISIAIISEEEISDAASTALATIRRQIREKQNSIRDKLNDIVKNSRYQKFMQESIVTMRGDRYVIPVKQEYRNEIQGLVHDSSGSGATIFIEPLSVVEANNGIKQLMIKEQVEIERILQELTGEVAVIIEPLKANISMLATLDFIFAKAKLSADYRCVSPKINCEGNIIIKKGRHPLIDQKAVVPIDFWIGKEFKTLVVTGPNTGGKTVTLKTVGLFTLMAQAGLHIPANEGSEISVFKKVFADIGDEQSIEQSLSTFSSHMKNIVGILKEADDKSLALFDELGAGTDPTEGAALAISILDHLRSIGTVTVSTTHYSELKVYAITTEDVENACCEFNVETLRPTYNLLIGVPGKSNAFAISKRLGLSDEIIDMAKERLTTEEVKFEDMLISIEKNRSQAEKDKMQTEALKLEIEKLRNDLANQIKKTNDQKEKVMREAREEARKIYLQAKRDAEDILSEMRKLERERDTVQRNKAVEEMRLKLKKNVDNLDEALTESILPKHGYVKPPQNLKPGDSVVIVNLNQKGTIITPPDKDGQAVVQAGVMKINVHVTNLRLVDEQKAEIKKTGSGRIGVSKTKTISTEIDLRGMNLEEALEAVDKYLDDASIAGLKEVTLIHGKGTGVLRSGIQQYLKVNSHVASYRLGKYGEGEAGVTVVEVI